MLVSRKVLPDMQVVARPAFAARMSRRTIHQPEHFRHDRLPISHDHSSQEVANQPIQGRLVPFGVNPARLDSCFVQGESNVFHLINIQSHVICVHWVWAGAYSRTCGNTPPGVPKCGVSVADARATAVGITNAPASVDQYRQPSSSGGRDRMNASGSTRARASASSASSVRWKSVRALSIYSCVVS